MLAAFCHSGVVIREWIVTTDLRAPDPRRIVTRQDFGRELTLAKEHGRFTVRQIAEIAGIPVSTAGGYLAGRHLPARGAEGVGRPGPRGPAGPPRPRSGRGRTLGP